MLKRLLIVPLLAAATFALAAHAPHKISFQGKLLDPATGDPRDGTFAMTFRLYAAPSGGAALYTETQPAVTVSNGVFAVQIGTVVALGDALFQNASAYLSVQVAADSEMSPRQQLLMAPYAYTATQLANEDETPVRAGNAYSTFTSAGNLLLVGGVSGSSGSFVNGVTASSGTFTATGSTQYSVDAASGVRVRAGTLLVDGAGGVDAAYGVAAATVVFTAATSDPTGTPLGTLYFNSSSGTLKLANGFNDFASVPAVTYQTLARTVEGNAATVAKAAAGTILLTPFYLSGPMVANSLILRVTTNLGATGDVGVYTSTGGLALNGGSGSVSTAAALKTITPAQSNRYLRPGQYYAAVTWNSTTGVIGGVNFNVAAAMPRCGSVLGGGSVLPATINPNAITNLQYCYFVALAQ